MYIFSNMNTMKRIILLLSISILFLATSCKSTKVVPEGLTASQLLQRGQDFYGSENYETAEMYYLAVIEQYGNDLNTYIEAKYELAHLYSKTKDYKKAVAAYNEILDYYNMPESYQLKPAFKKLSEQGLSRIPQDKLN